MYLLDVHLIKAGAGGFQVPVKDVCNPATHKKEKETGRAYLIIVGSSYTFKLILTSLLKRADYQQQKLEVPNKKFNRKYTH